MRILALVFFVCVSANGAFASSLEKMEDVVKKAPDLRSFLADPALVDEYYQEAIQYYGHFPRGSYDAVLRQLRELNQKVPGLGERMWESSGLGRDFKIPLAVPVSGLQTNQDAWSQHFGQLQEANRLKSERLAAMPPKERNEAVRRVFERKIQEIETFERDVLAKAPKAEKGRLTQEFYRARLRESEELAEIGAYLAHTKLGKSGPLQKMLKSGSADGILFAWAALRKAKGLDSSSLKVPDRLQRFVADAALPELPVPAKLEVVDGKPVATSLFTVAVKPSREGKPVPIGSASAGDIDIKAIPRRFHGIFKGIQIGECVGGNCNSLAGLTPERWATSALKESRLYHVQKSGSFHGFVQMVPVSLGDKTYASLEFGSPLLAKSGFVLEEKSGQAAEQPFTTALLTRMKSEIPPDWRGVVVSADNAINNAQVLEGFRTTAPYTQGAVVGRRSQVRHLDPLAAEIILNSPQSGGLISGYAGNMITDATAKADAELRQINLLASGASNDEKLLAALKDPAKILAIFRNGKTEFKESVKRLLARNPPALPTIKKLLRLATERSEQLPEFYRERIANAFIPDLEPELSRYLIHSRGHQPAQLLTRALIYRGWGPILSTADREMLLAETIAHSGQEPVQFLQANLLHQAALSPPDGSEALAEFLKATPARDRIGPLVNRYYSELEPDATDRLSPWLRERLHLGTERSLFENALLFVQTPQFWAETMPVLVSERTQLAPEARAELLSLAWKNKHLPPQALATSLDGVERFENQALRTESYKALLRIRELPPEPLARAFPEAAKILKTSDLEYSNFGVNGRAYFARTPDSPQKEELYRWLLAQESTPERGTLLAHLLGAYRDPPVREKSAYLARWVLETDSENFTRGLAHLNGEDIAALPPASAAKLKKKVESHLIQQFQRADSIHHALLKASLKFPPSERQALAAKMLTIMREKSAVKYFPVILLQDLPLDQSFVREYSDILQYRRSDYHYMGEASQAAYNQLRGQFAEWPPAEALARKQIQLYREEKRPVEEARYILTQFRERKAALPADLSKAYLEIMDPSDPWIEAALKAAPEAKHPLGEKSSVLRAYLERLSKELSAADWDTLKNALYRADRVAPGALAAEMLQNPILKEEQRAFILARYADPAGASREKKMAQELASLLFSEGKGKYAERYASIPGVGNFIRAYEPYLRQFSHPMISRVESCGRAFASFGLVRGGALGLAAAGATGGAAYYAVDSLRDRIYPCGDKETRGRRLVKKGDRWYCESGLAEASCSGASPEGYQDLRWAESGVSGSEMRSIYGYRIMNYFNDTLRGLDGETYGRCNNQPNRLICTTCKGSDPIHPKEVEIRKSGIGTFAVAPDGTKELLSLDAPNDYNYRLVFREEDGKYVRVARPAMEVIGARKRPKEKPEMVLLEETYPNLREYIRKAEEKRKAKAR